MTSAAAGSAGKKDVRKIRRRENPCKLTIGLRKLDLVVLLALAEELVEAKQLVRDEEGYVDLARDPVIDLKASGVDEKDVGEGGEASGPAREGGQRRRGEGKRRLT